jgi:hypothetical protein
MPKPKRPRDVNQLAKFIVDLTTGQIATPDPFEGKDRKRAEAGRIGGLRGGKARADTLSDKRKKEIAKKGATARWQKRPD